MDTAPGTIVRGVFTGPPVHSSLVTSLEWTTTTVQHSALDNKILCELGWGVPRGRSVGRGKRRLGGRDPHRPGPSSGCLRGVTRVASGFVAAKETAGVAGVCPAWGLRPSRRSDVSGSGRDGERVLDRTGRDVGYRDGDQGSGRTGEVGECRDSDLEGVSAVTSVGCLGRTMVSGRPTPCKPSPALVRDGNDVGHPPKTRPLHPRPGPLPSTPRSGLGEEDDPGPVS